MGLFDRLKKSSDALAAEVFAVPAVLDEESGGITAITAITATATLPIPKPETPPASEPETASQDIPSRPDQVPGQATPPGGGETGLKTANPGQSDTVTWNSPLFGVLEAPAMERGPETFTLRHHLTGEIVELPNEWLISLEERAAILEFDGNASREEADRQAKIEFFGLFRRGGKP